VDGGRGMGAAGFCGPYVCFGVFLLLWWRVLVSGIGGGIQVVNSWYSRLVSRWCIFRREG
jgi:hypothetical protein